MSDRNERTYVFGNRFQLSLICGKPGGILVLSHTKSSLKMSLGLYWKSAVHFGLSRGTRNCFHMPSLGISVANGSKRLACSGVNDFTPTTISTMHVTGSKFWNEIRVAFQYYVVKWTASYHRRSAHTRILFDLYFIIQFSVLEINILLPSAVANCTVNSKSLDCALLKSTEIFISIRNIYFYYC